MTKYIISRTSCYSDEQPCDEARHEMLTAIDRRTCSLAEAQKSAWWDSFADYNDRWEEVDGELRGYQSEPAWVIESTIEEIFEEYGDLVIHDSAYVEVPVEVEIYDFWRE